MAGDGHHGRQGAWAVAGGDCRGNIWLDRRQTASRRFVVGLAANTISAGFIGGMIGGYIAGYIALAIIKNVKVPDWARGLMPTLIVPFLPPLSAA